MNLNRFYKLHHTNLSILVAREYIAVAAVLALNMFVNSPTVLRMVAMYKLDIVVLLLEQKCQ